MNTILITGAARGFGRELLRAYAEKGWRTFPLVRKEMDASALLTEHSRECYPIIGDVGQDSISATISEQLGRHTDSLDLLINNAGIILKNRDLLGTSPQEIIDHFNIHCVGAYRCVVAVLPLLSRAKQPKIVNISSRWGSISTILKWDRHHIYSYQIAKCAQNMLSACLHQELKRRNIRVFVIHPGRLKTSVAPFDADTEPRDAAQKLANWLEIRDHAGELKCYDIISDTVIDW